MTWSFLKFILTIAVVLLLAINSCADPHNLTFFTGESAEYNRDTRAAAFALIAAIAALVSVLPRGYGILAGLTTFVARLTPLAGAALAGWFWVYAATKETPLPYLQEMGTIGIIFGVLAFGVIGMLLVLYVFVSIVAFLLPLAWRITTPLRRRLTWIARKILLNLSILTLVTLVWSVLILAATVWSLWIVSKFIWERISHLFP